MSMYEADLTVFVNSLFNLKWIDVSSAKTSQNEIR
jgi:hypothetical protein